MYQWRKLQFIVWFVTDIHWYQLDINQTSMSCVSISIRYQTVICVRIDINVHIRKVVVKSIKYHCYTDSPVLPLWCVLILDEQWNERKCHNSKCIASTHRLHDTTKSCFTYHVIHFTSPNHMCLPEIKCVYRDKMLLHLWWGDTFMVCCYIYKNLWRP